MTAALDLLALIATALVVVTGIAALASAALVPLLRRRLETLALRGNVRGVLLVLAAPLGVAGVLTSIAFVPPILGALGVVPDHCSVPRTRAHLCFVHLPHDLEASWWAWVALALMLALVARAALETGLEARRGHRLARALSLAAVFDRDRGVLLVDSPAPLALTAAGGRVFVSSGLLAALQPMELAAALAHERCHAEERHGRLLFWGALLGTGHLPFVRRSLVQLLELSCERRADEAAASQVGDRAEVAGALLAARRLVSHAGYGGALLALARKQSLTLRIRELLQPTACGGRSPWAAPGLVAAVLGLVAASAFIHNSIEAALSLLVR